MTGREFLAAIQTANPSWEDDPLRLLLFEEDTLKLIELHPEIPVGLGLRSNPEHGAYATIIRFVPGDTL
jgi:hypothetical protein